MKETTPDKYPYPEDTDAPNGPVQIKALADQIQKLEAIRGRVTAAGALASGSGFTVEKKATGEYLLKWTTEFSVEPLIFATAQGGTPRIVSCSALEGKKEAKIFIADAAGALVDNIFSFEARIPV